MGWQGDRNGQLIAQACGQNLSQTVQGHLPGIWRVWPQVCNQMRQVQNWEPGEWQQGWQHWAYSISDAFLRKTQNCQFVQPLVARISVPLWTQCWGSARPRTHSSGVRDSLTSVQDVVVGRTQLPLQIDETRCTRASHHLLLSCWARIRASLPVATFLVAQ